MSLISFPFLVKDVLSAEISWSPVGDENFRKTCGPLRKYFMALLKTLYMIDYEISIPCPKASHFSNNAILSDGSADV